MYACVFYISVECYLYNILSGWWGLHWKSKNFILTIMHDLYHTNYDNLVNELLFQAEWYWMTAI